MIPKISRKVWALKGDRAGQHAIAVNEQWRICFRFEDGDAYDVEFCDTLVMELASAAGVSRQSINQLVRERRALSPEMALRLGKLFSTSPEYWLNMQRNLDLWDAAVQLKKEMAEIRPFQAALRGSRWGQ